MIAFAEWRDYERSCGALSHALGLGQEDAQQLRAMLKEVHAATDPFAKRMARWKLCDFIGGMAGGLDPVRGFPVVIEGKKP